MATVWPLPVVVDGSLYALRRSHGVYPAWALVHVPPATVVVVVAWVVVVVGAVVVVVGAVVVVVAAVVVVVGATVVVVGATVVVGPVVVVGLPWPFPLLALGLAAGTTISAWQRAWPWGTGPHTGRWVVSACGAPPGGAANTAPAPAPTPASTVIATT